MGVRVNTVGAYSSRVGFRVCYAVLSSMRSIKE